MFNMKSFLLIAVFGYSALVSFALNIDHGQVQKTNSSQKSEKREPISAFTTAMIGAAISAGTSLTGTTVSALMAPGYSVAVSGSVENFSKWTMIKEDCTPEYGVIDKPMVNVDPGKKEGFASHKGDGTTAGSWVYCWYKVNGKKIHIMYSAPYNFNHHSNYLSLAITGMNKDLDANKMYYKSYSYMDRKEYYEKVGSTEICNEGFCIKGSMGTSHRPVINIKLYPKSFKNTSPSVKKSLGDGKSEDEASKMYAKYIKDEFH